MVDETGAIHHDQLLYNLPKEFNYEFVLGGGRWGENTIPSWLGDTMKWEFDFHSHDFGAIVDHKLQKLIAAIISNGEQDQILDKKG